MLIGTSQGQNTI